MPCQTGLFSSKIQLNITEHARQKGALVYIIIAISHLYTDIFYMGSQAHSMCSGLPRQNKTLELCDNRIYHTIIPIVKREICGYCTY